VPNIIINYNFCETAISILAISNHNNFRVLFDKIASVYFCLKNKSTALPIVSAQERPQDFRQGANAPLPPKICFENLTAKW